jgi:hypothetical protein
MIHSPECLAFHSLHPLITPLRPCYTVLSHPARCRIRRLLIRNPWYPLKGFGSRTMHAALEMTHLSGRSRRLNEQGVCQSSSSRVKRDIIGIVLLQHKMAAQFRVRNTEEG